MMKPKTKLEKNAFAAMIRCRELDGLHLLVEWKKSRNYGNCPSLTSRSFGKLSYASGCGYDTLSAVLADAMRWLGETAEQQRAIWRTGGCGACSVQEALSSVGWKLTIREGKTEDQVQLDRLALQDLKGAEA